MSKSFPDFDQAVPAGIMRRLAAMLYDTVLVCALVVVAFAALYLPLAIGFGITETKNQPLWFIYMLLIVMGFYVWFWTHGGQTLGMRAWRIRLFSKDGGGVSYGQAAIRFLVAILSLGALGLGFIWSLFDEKKRTWHDIASGTQMVLMKKKGR